jgi:hypothetical protein
MPSYDSINLTSYSESSPRTMRVDTLQVHHATTTSLAACRALMDAGGRQVSANYAMGNDGNLMLVVPVERRAFTSASSYDNRSITVEVCNTTLGPSWGISYASHLRLAQLAAEMWFEGLLGGINRTYIIGHNEVPGSYATACPGPSMNLDLVVALTLQLVQPAPKENPDMAHIYIYEKDYKWGAGLRGALIHDTNIPGGVKITTSEAEGEMFSAFAKPIGLTRVQFDAAVAEARAQFVTRRTEQVKVDLGNVTFPAPDNSALEAAVKSLPAQIGASVAAELAKRLAS